MFKFKMNRFEENKKASVARLQAFSDGLIAIIITLMVLGIPLPKSMTSVELFSFGKSIVIYFASFIIIAIQWNRHYHLLEGVTEVSNSFIWKNIVYLFFLSLVPLMMNWLVSYPDNVIPAILYSIVYLVEDLLMRWLFISLYKESEEKRTIVREHRMQSCKIAGGGKCDGEKIPTRLVIYIVIHLIVEVAIIIVSLYQPRIAIISFIAFPVVTSMDNLFIGSDENIEMNYDPIEVF